MGYCHFSLLPVLLLVGSHRPPTYHVSDRYERRGEKSPVTQFDFEKSGWETGWEIYNLKEEAVMESDLTLHPPHAESPSCLSRRITLGPAAAVSEPCEGAVAVSLTGQLSHWH